MTSPSGRSRSSPRSPAPEAQGLVVHPLPAVVVRREEPLRGGQVDVAGADPLETGPPGAEIELGGVAEVRGRDRRAGTAAAGLDLRQLLQAGDLVDQALGDQQGQGVQRHTHGRWGRLRQRAGRSRGQDVRGPWRPGRRPGRRPRGALPTRRRGDARRSTGGRMPGIAALASTPSTGSPVEISTSWPLSRSAATRWVGTRACARSSMPAYVCTSRRRRAAEATPAIRPNDPPQRPDAGWTGKMSPRRGPGRTRRRARPASRRPTSRAPATPRAAFPAPGQRCRRAGWPRADAMGVRAPPACPTLPRSEAPTSGTRERGG